LHDQKKTVGERNKKPARLKSSTNSRNGCSEAEEKLVRQEERNEGDRERRAKKY